MFTVAARTMGYRVIVLDPDPDSPAGRMADEHLHAAYTDAWALDQMAAACAAVTTEFENVPAESLERLARHCPVRPSARALERAQDRIEEKTYVRRLGLETVPFQPVRTVGDLPSAWQAVGGPAILKRASLGYDGKGQMPVATQVEAEQAFHAMGEAPCVLERRVDLALELSVILARSVNGECAAYPSAENAHRGGILHQSIVPARIEPGLAEQARAMAVTLAEGMDYVGVMAVEFFVTGDRRLLVNEIAPRPHNSGHFTIDACVTSQFEQQVRAICGLPFGDTALLSPVVMTNLLGDLWQPDVPDWSVLLAHPRTKLHLYGKRVARPGRKMGHYCVLDESIESAIVGADAIFAGLGDR
jgi:5-(carboxyamino)imidazole ribonucleotide synthase